MPRRASPVLDIALASPPSWAPFYFALAVSLFYFALADMSLPGFTSGTHHESVTKVSELYHSVKALPECYQSVRHPF